MKRPYDVAIKATLDLVTEINAESSADAIEIAKGLLRDTGTISNVEVDRCIFLDDEEVPA